MSYFLILFAAALVVAVSFIFYQQRKIEKEHLDSKHRSAPQAIAPTVSISTHLNKPKAVVDSEKKVHTMKDGHTANLLIVDDQYSIRLMLSELFTASGIRVFEAETGVVALDICSIESIDCVLLDLKLPDMDGIEILQGIRSIAREVPVVLISAYASPEKLEDAVALGVSQCFTKPFDIIELKNVVLQLCDQYSRKATT
ncbi:CheY-like chemotaxis protein [Paenibacillus endophyticus]|uniref:CheY-like chemotaxis protein n=1 Tax=Paenibacillus endophyticus TaxID=1294268 RepID=A0A7W5C7P9_9BACL|nr:response regulator [Paenibacillus endophyticus]MBB3151609.1 CheY-like chemotaxis protein [Paenibacillus endophyticus]